MEHPAASFGIFRQRPIKNHEPAPEINAIVRKGKGVSFQDGHHVPGDCGTAPKPNNLLAAAPRNIIATANIVFCACSAKS